MLHAAQLVRTGKRKRRACVHQTLLPRAPPFRAPSHPPAPAQACHDWTYNVTHLEEAIEGGFNSFDLPLVPCAASRVCVKGTAGPSCTSSPQEVGNPAYANTTLPSSALPCPSS